MRATGRNASEDTEKGKGFALVWLDGYLAPLPEKFDLLIYAEVDRANYAASFVAPDYSVVVSMCTGMPMGVGIAAAPI